MPANPVSVRHKPHCALLVDVLGLGQSDSLFIRWRCLAAWIVPGAWLPQTVMTRIMIIRIFHVQISTSHVVQCTTDVTVGQRRAITDLNGEK